jgi:hypothetical protein
MRQVDTISLTGRVFAGLAFVVLGLWASGSAGCSLLLETDVPSQCSTDADCARYSNSECDNVRRLCVRRLPYGGGGGAGTSGASIDSGGGGGSGGSGGLACQLSFDNQRIQFRGPDGGLRPLTEGP